jgi:hypothetical protein
MQRAASAIPRGGYRQTQRRYTTNDVRSARASYRERAVAVLPNEPVDTGGAEPVSECVDGESVSRHATCPLRYCLATQRFSR